MRRRWKRETRVRNEEESGKKNHESTFFSPHLAANANAQHDEANEGYGKQHSNHHHGIGRFPPSKVGFERRRRVGRVVHLWPFNCTILECRNGGPKALEGVCFCFFFFFGFGLFGKAGLVCVGLSFYLE
jgi:hypothetical protein